MTAPTFDCERQGNTVRFLWPCPACGKRHSHGLTDDLSTGLSEHRVSECRGHGLDGYYIRVADPKTAKATTAFWRYLRKRPATDCPISDFAEDFIRAPFLFDGTWEGLAAALPASAHPDVLAAAAKAAFDEYGT